MSYIFYCPNCKGIISSNDKECPHCGQSFDNTAVRYKVVEPIFYKNRKLGSGIFYIIICLFFFAVGAYFVSKVSLPLGIITIGIGGFSGLVAGRSIIGTKMGNCPHCGKLLILSNVKKHFDCPICKKNILIQQGHLETPMLEVESNVIEGINTIDDVKEKLVNMISQEFERNGWNKWDRSIHESPQQLERLKRGTSDDEQMSLQRYDENMGIAKFKGSSGKYYLTSGERCSCPDFRERLKPCKHMYRLAVIIPEYKEYLEKDDSIQGSRSDDNIFGELQFSIVGSNQSPVKEYITKHSGMYGSSQWKETSAIVLASDIMTERRVEAIARDVQIFSFEQLKTLFNNVKAHDKAELNEQQVGENEKSRQSETIYS